MIVGKMRFLISHPDPRNNDKPSLLRTPKSCSCESREVDGKNWMVASMDCKTHGIIKESQTLKVMAKVAA